MTSTAPTATIERLRTNTTATLFGQTMGLVALTSGLFALGAYIGRDSSGGWAWVWFIAAFASLLTLNAAAQRSEQLSVALLFAFGPLLSFAVAPTVGVYLNADPASRLPGRRRNSALHRRRRSRVAALRALCQREAKPALCLVVQDRAVLRRVVGEDRHGL
jgi:hypothetical protein